MQEECTRCKFCCGARHGSSYRNAATLGVKGIADAVVAVPPFGVPFDVLDAKGLVERVLDVTGMHGVADLHFACAVVDLEGLAKGVCPSFVVRGGRS